MVARAGLEPARAFAQWLSFLQKRRTQGHLPAGLGHLAFLLEAWWGLGASIPRAPGFSFLNYEPGAVAAFCTDRLS